VADQELLTIAEIAKRIDVPESTVRYYRDRFGSSVPSVGSGRRRRYSQEAVAVLRFIANQSRVGTPYEEIERQLAERFPIDVSSQTQISKTANASTAATQQQPSASTEAQIQALREALGVALDPLIRAIIEEQTATLQQELAAVRKQLDDATARAERTASERDQQLVATMRGMLEERRRAPWWKFWDRSQP
jgi:DNA-binding transcriptional MerR regulator